MLLSRQHITIISTFLCFNAFHSVEDLEQNPKSVAFEDVKAIDWLHECVSHFKQNALANYRFINSSNYEDFENKFPPLNLPKYITFPESVKDVKKAILHASSACIGVS